MIQNFWHDEAGATAIEYALIASIVSVGILAALMLLNERIVDLFSVIEEHVVPALSGN